MIFDYKIIFFLFYVAKSISLEVISFFKISTFAAIFAILTSKLEILKLNWNNYYLATEIEKKYFPFLKRRLFWNKPFSGFVESHILFLHNLESSNFLRRREYIERKTPAKNILEFLKHFSFRSHHKPFFWTTLYILYRVLGSNPGERKFNLTP